MFFAVLPTGYGKSLVFHILPTLLFAKKKLDDTNSSVLSYPQRIFILSPRSIWETRGQPQPGSFLERVG